MQNKDDISISVIKRLPRYYRFLQSLKDNGIVRISSKELAARMGLCIDNSPTCAVTCIPSTDMEELTDLLVKVGIKSFLNFSNYDIAMAHPGVIVENVHLRDSLLTLGYLTNTSLNKSEE